MLLHILLNGILAFGASDKFMRIYSHNSNSRGIQDIGGVFKITNSPSLFTFELRRDKLIEFKPEDGEPLSLNPERLISNGRNTGWVFRKVETGDGRSANEEYNEFQLVNGKLCMTQRGSRIGGAECQEEKFDQMFNIKIVSGEETDKKTASNDDNSSNNTYAVPELFVDPEREKEVIIKEDEILTLKVRRPAKETKYVKVMESAPEPPKQSPEPVEKKPMPVVPPQIMAVPPGTVPVPVQVVYSQPVIPPTQAPQPQRVYMEVVPRSRTRHGKSPLGRQNEMSNSEDRDSNIYDDSGSNPYPREPEGERKKKLAGRNSKKTPNRKTGQQSISRKRPTKPVDESDGYQEPEKRKMGKRTPVYQNTPRKRHSDFESSENRPSEELSPKRKKPRNKEIESTEYDESDLDTSIKKLKERLHLDTKPISDKEKSERPSYETKPNRPNEIELLKSLMSKLAGKNENDSQPEDEKRDMNDSYEGGEFGPKGGNRMYTDDGNNYVNKGHDGPNYNGAMGGQNMAMRPSNRLPQQGFNYGGQAGVGNGVFPGAYNNGYTNGGPQTPVGTNMSQSGGMNTGNFKPNWDNTGMEGVNRGNNPGQNGGNRFYSNENPRHNTSIRYDRSEMPFKTRKDGDGSNEAQIMNKVMENSKLEDLIELFKQSPSDDYGYGSKNRSGDGRRGDGNQGESRGGMRRTHGRIRANDQGIRIEKIEAERSGPR